MSKKNHKKSKGLKFFLFSVEIACGRLIKQMEEQFYLFDRGNHRFSFDAIDNILCG